MTKGSVKFFKKRNIHSSAESLMTKRFKQH